MVRVKICGITNLEDGRAAVEAGADYLGFIFYPPSKRSITVDEAERVVGELRARPDCPLLVGVFVNEPADKVAAVLARVGLDLAQLSGDETPNLIGDPESLLYGRCYKALRPTTFTEAVAEAEWYLPPNSDPHRPNLLLDTYHPTLHGGTGRVVDWQMAARLAETVPQLMLAGGLNPDNVAEAVRQVRPFAVDVASGVEAQPGRKDQDKVAAFIRAAKGTVHAA